MKPILFHLLHEPIYSYPLLMGLGWGVGYNITASLWSQAKLPEKVLKAFFILTFVIAWIGAKAFFLIFSAPEKALDYSKEINFWMGGGFVFYGGLVFAGLFAVLFFKFQKGLALSHLGLVTPGVALGHAIGRIGCLLAGCCFGDQCDLPIAITVNGLSRHPVQIYESIGLVIIFFILNWLWKKRRDPLMMLSSYMLSYSTLRMINEFFRGDSIRGIHYGLSTSQWVSVVIFIMGTVVHFKAIKES